MNARLRAAIIAARQENMSKDIDRARDQEGERQRQRELRRDPLRGLRSGRRRRDRRGADRQPQPRRLRHPLLLHQVRRQSRRNRLGRLHVRPHRRHRISTPRSPPTTRCWMPRSRPAPTTWSSSESGHEVYASPETFREVAKALEAKFGEPRKAALTWKPQNTVAGGRRDRREAVEADRSSERARRRPERLRQFRGLRRADGEDGRVAVRRV